MGMPAPWLMVQACLPFLPAEQTTLGSVTVVAVGKVAVQLQHHIAFSDLAFKCWTATSLLSKLCSLAEISRFRWLCHTAPVCREVRDEHQHQHCNTAQAVAQPLLHCVALLYHTQLELIIDPRQLAGPK